MTPLTGFPDYQITKNGQIWSSEHKKFLRQYLTYNGYLFVSLKNKTASGSNHGMAKLSEPDVRFIIYMYYTGLFTCQEVGTHFGISLQMVYYIVTRKNWKHIWKGQI